MEDLTGKQLGPYRIVAPLGEGGMAAVYKAYQASVDRHVALKILPRHYAADPDFVARFEQEAKVIAGLEHPSILPVYDYGEAEGYTYIVMRYVEGGALARLLQGKSLSLRQICHVISQVAAALDYAHAKGVVHRDVKPSNVLLDDQGNCLLTDFGIARIIEATGRFTTTGAFIGTPSYASPEQALGHAVDGRSDVYSLGVMLYEMVVGRPPFDAETPMAILIKHIHDPLPMPRSLRPALSEAVERTILKALAKEPEDRYQTAGELARALAAAAAAEGTPPGRAVPAATPPRPQPAPAARRLSLWGRVGVGLIALCLIGGLLGGGIALVSYLRRGPAAATPGSPASPGAETPVATQPAPETPSGPTGPWQETASAIQTTMPPTLIAVEQTGSAMETAWPATLVAIEKTAAVIETARAASTAPAQGTAPATPLTPSPIPPAAAGGALAVGEVVTGEIRPSGEVDSYSFQGKAGDWVPVVAVGTEDAPWLSLVVEIWDPQGAPVQAEANDLWRLPTDGRYTMGVHEAGTRTGPYLLKLGSNLVRYGYTVAGEARPAGEVDLYSFAGQAGDIVLMALTDTTAEGRLSMAMELLDPQGQSLASANVWVQDTVAIEQPLTAEGLYLVRVWATGQLNSLQVGSYAWLLKDISARAGTQVRYGDVIEGQIDPPGDADIYTLEWKPGEAPLIKLDVGAFSSGGYGNCKLYVEVFDAQRNSLARDSGTASIQVRPYLSDAGVYTVVVGETRVMGGHCAGSYTLSIENSPGP